MSHVKPHGPVSVDTVGRWVKSVMESAGICVKTFAPHSIRGASALSLTSTSVSIDEVMKVLVGRVRKLLPDNIISTSQTSSTLVQLSAGVNVASCVNSLISISMG